MNLLNKFNQSLGFTQTESRVVVFLILTFLLGAGVKVYKSNMASGVSHDYGSSDSEFAARSSLLTSTDSISAKYADNENDVKRQSTPATKNSHEDLLPQSININTASKNELAKLPGIGEAMAERIILYRKEHGRFTAVNDLMNVKGIGKKKLERMAPYCTLGK